MHQYPAFLSATQELITEDTWNYVLITVPDSPEPTLASLYIRPPHAVYLKHPQIPHQVSLLDPSTKMEPAFDCQNSASPSITKITLHNHGQTMTIQPISQTSLIQIYEKLKKTLAHKGFSDYFKPVKRLGKGAFATVYLVQHRFTHQQLAAKVFSREGQKLEYRGGQALDNQIYLLRSLQHPNIIRYEGVYQTDNLIYLVTEYLAGGTLQDTLRHKTALNGPLINNILHDALQALLYLRKHAILHRDLKPQNILLRNHDQKWVLADFGLAAQQQRTPLFSKCGTIGYMAPQIMAQKSPLSVPIRQQNENTYQSSIPATNDFACDMYSLGIIAYELIVGALPFRLQSRGVLQKQLIWDGFSREQFKELEEEAAQLLRGLLQERPERRMGPQQALGSRFFGDQKSVDRWNRFCQAKINKRYDKILKMANCN